MQFWIRLKPPGCPAVLTRTSWTDGRTDPSLLQLSGLKAPRLRITWREEPESASLTVLESKISKKKKKKLLAADGGVFPEDLLCRSIQLDFFPNPLLLIVRVEEGFEIVSDPAVFSLEAPFAASLVTVHLKL